MIPVVAVLICNTVVICYRLVVWVVGFALLSTVEEKMRQKTHAALQKVASTWKHDDSSS